MFYFVLGDKTGLNRMESRIRELESSLFVENRKMSDTMKSMKQSERRMKELTFSADEDRKNQERMQVHKK